MKKLFSVLLSLCMLTGVMPHAIAAKTVEEDDNTAYVEFGKDGAVKHNITLASMSGTTSETFVYASAGGREGWQLKSSSPYLYIDIDDKWAHEVTDGTVFEVEVDYYDTLTGFFVIEYDGAKTTRKYAQIVGVDKSNQWKTAKVTLDDAYFAGRCVGADLRLAIRHPMKRNGDVTSSAPVTFGAIRITKYEKKNPLKLEASTDESGNAFRWFSEEKPITNTFTNLRETPITAEVHYKGVSDDGIVVLDKTETITVEGSGTYTSVVNVDSDYCGVYNYEVFIDSEEDEVHSEYKPFQFAILKTDENGYKNKDIYLCDHPDQNMNEEETVQLISILDKSNAGGMRTSMLNGFLKTEEGIDSNWVGWTAREMRKYGLKFMPILLGPVNYENVPQNDEEEELFKAYITRLMKKAGDVIDYYELLNEPNHSLNSTNVETKAGGAINFGRMGRAAKEVRDAYDPTAKIIGYSMTDLGNENQQTWFDNAIKGGAFDSIDYTSWHSYSYSDLEVSSPEKLTTKWSKYIADQAGMEEKPRIESEVGYTQADSVTDGDARTQGNLMTRYDTYFSSQGHTDKMCLYNMTRKGDIPYLREDMYGITSPAYQHLVQEQKTCIPTEGFVAVTGHNYVFADTDFKESLKNDDDCYIHLFYSNKYDCDIISMNTSAREKNRCVTLDLGTDYAELYDDFGNMQVVTGHDGKFTFRIDERLAYVKGSFNNPKFIEGNNNFLEVASPFVVGAKNDVVAVEYKNYTDKTYDVEVILPENMELYGDSQITPGNSEVMLIPKGEVGTESMAVINIKDGDKIVQSTEVFVTVEKSITAETQYELIDPSNVDNWQVQLKLTNTSKLNVAKGYIEFKSPEEYTSVGKIDIGNIPRGTTSKYTIKLPKLVKKGIYNIEFDLHLDDGTVYSYVNQADMTVAKYAEVKPVIDGVLEPEAWKYNTWMYAERADQLKENLTWSGPDDLSGKASLMWDEENLYFAAEVTDDIFYQPYSGWDTWKADNIQMGIFYGSEGYVVSGQRSTTFHEISMAHTPIGDEIYRTLSQENYYKAGKLENAEVCIVRSGNKTTYEVRIPWEGYLLPNQQPQEGDQLGFSYMINESDGGSRNGWIEYASGIGSAKDTTLFTWLTLLK